MAQRKRNTRTEQENFAIKEKVEELISQGIREDRAIAAAFRMFRDGELRGDIQNVPRLSERQQRIRREQRRRRRLAIQPGAVIVDAITLGSFINLYKQFKLSTKKKKAKK